MDKRLIRFLNEVARPLSEKTRGLYVESLSTQPNINLLLDLLPVDNSVVLDDGRLGEGVNQITSGEAKALVAFLNDFIGFVEKQENQVAVNAIYKLCVRPLRVE